MSYPTRKSGSTCFFRKSVVLISIILPLLLFSCVPNGDNRPNVVVILTDDQGSVDAAVYGSNDLATPSIDRLASRGVLFTRFYSASAICSPSRAALLTGLSPQSAGVAGNVSSQPGVPGMPGEIVTIAELMRDAGYATGHIGKWHLGYSEGTMPLAQGFDYSFGHMGGCIDNYSHFFYWNGPNRHDLWENGEEVQLPGHYFPELMSEKALEFIRKNRKNPFFLYYAINIPHYPLQPTTGWQQYYSNTEMPRRDYAAFVSTADEIIGELTEYLDRQNLTRNTLIIWLSDHGHSYEERTFGGGGNSGPFRGGKTSLFDGGIRVPALMSLPGRIPPGEKRNQVAYSCDIVPTILSFAGISYDPGQFEGIDISAAVTGNHPVADRDLYWKLGSQWAIMREGWKLVGLPVDPSGVTRTDPMRDRLFLSDMRTDSSETVNLAESFPGKREELIAAYLDWKHADSGDIPSGLTSIDHAGRGSGVRLENTPSQRYQGDGPGTLTDGLLGSKQHADGLWLGFEQRDMVAVIDLGELKEIGSATARFLNNPGSWIFQPKYLEAEISDDGKQFRPAARIITDNAGLREIAIREYPVMINNRARYLRIRAVNTGVNPDWHPYPGGAAWLFCDEIIIMDNPD